MAMGSKADFYVGRGADAEWLGSIQWDGLPSGLPKKLLESSTEEGYRKEIDTLFFLRGDSIRAEDGWPWPWDSSLKTKYTYAFDVETCQVMASCYGSSWWVASEPEPDHTTLERKVAIFPNMSSKRKTRTRNSVG